MAKEMWQMGGDTEILTSYKQPLCYKSFLTSSPHLSDPPMLIDSTYIALYGTLCMTRNLGNSINCLNLEKTGSKAEHID